MIVAVDNPDSLGLYIPRHDTWDRSHPPELHTELIRDANESSGIAYARVVRLVKHWNRTHDKPLCSWNIKALALTSVAEPTTMIAGIRAWLEHAVDQLSKGETPDPARVALHPPIRTNKPRTEVVRSLRKALESIDLAVSLERDGYPTLALDELAKLFKDEEMLPPGQTRGLFLRKKPAGLLPTRPKTAKHTVPRPWLREPEPPPTAVGLTFVHGVPK